MTYKIMQQTPEMIIASQFIGDIYCRKLREQMLELERQAEIFLKMGFSMLELTVVSHQDGTVEVAPQMAIR